MDGLDENLKTQKSFYTLTVKKNQIALDIKELNDKKSIVLNTETNEIFENGKKTPGICKGEGGLFFFAPEVSFSNGFHCESSIGVWNRFGNMDEIKQMRSWEPAIQAGIGFQNIPGQFFS